MSKLSSFADVRDYALSGEGECCADDDRLECLMQECLEVFWTQLPLTDRVKTETLTTVKGQTSYPLPVGVNQVSSPSLGPCRLARRPPVCHPCPDGGKAMEGEPKSFHVEHGNLIIDPAPDKPYTVAYDTYPDVDCLIKDAAGVWQNLPFPAKYHSVYKQMVRAKSVMESDPQRGANLFNMANSSLNLLVSDAKKNRDSNRWSLNSDVSLCRCKTKSGCACPQTWKHCPFPEEP
jgi:hypothetical protein